MPYHEDKDNAWSYYNAAVEAMNSGSKGTAKSYFTLAKAIAEKNKMKDLIALIESKEKRL